MERRQNVKEKKKGVTPGVELEEGRNLAERRGGLATKKKKKNMDQKKRGKAKNDLPEVQGKRNYLLEGKGPLNAGEKGGHRGSTTTTYGIREKKKTERLFEEKKRLLPEKGEKKKYHVAWGMRSIYLRKGGGSRKGGRI